MGRSQVKYRATHGRGRGRGRGDAAGGRGGASGRGRSSHVRNLGSNAFRFEEREEAQDDEQQMQGDYGRRTQFFASEQSYREQMGGAYFQSRTMKQWEEKDDAADDQAAVGVLDLDWIASQLALVPPDVRYRMDPKYCIDLPFEPQDEEEAEADEEIAKEQSSAAATVASAAAPVVGAPSKPAKADAELDFLLNLSASTATGAKTAPILAMPIAAAPTPTRTVAETEQLEEWLDDVLDM
ncbi:hypothetical protein PR001_g235 [Phytophthora rubi]|uniref:Uncharacterized protein n=1 Tax=Phytophthora rubi TaxID=129364 RepID=A0A6A3NSP9_9STRA|nr:hypothetical protein PR002_g465 [Phytophthora rubi]KAE9052755.1 hypothetical protein PR001_g235 [Phytophthora rubi]